MNGDLGWKIVWTLGGAAIAFLLSGIFILQLFVVFWLIGSSDDIPSVRTIASILVDEVVEAGAFPTSSVEGKRLTEYRSILLTHAINENTSDAIVERLLLLDEENPETPIDLYLSSPGGWVGSAFTIIDAMHRVAAPVNSHAIGQCYSSCAMILAAATGRRTATESTLIMVHANLDDSEEPYSYGRADKLRCENLWHEYSLLPDEWFPMTRDKAYYLSAREALAFGIIDEVVAEEKHRSSGESSGVQ